MTAPAPSVVVLPVSGTTGRQTEQEAADIAATVQQALHERSHPQPEQRGPITKILAAHPDSLYKYISWEDPSRTLGAYFGALGLLAGAHYLPLTQVALKAGVTTLGAVSVTEFASRSFSENSLSSRLRPREYKTIPEPTLNATLKDVHDFIQYATVQAQRILFGQDLQNTFITFLGLGALYWLTAILGPFGLAVVALTTVFAAPLATSIQGRRLAKDATVAAGDLAGAAVQQGKVLAHDGSVKASELSSKAGQTASNLTTQAGQTASNLTTQAGQTASNLSTQAGQTASNLTTQAGQTVGAAVQNTRDLAYAGERKAADLTSQGINAASEITAQAGNTVGAAAGKSRDLAYAGEHRAAELGTQGLNSASDAATRAGNTASNAASYAGNTASDLSSRAGNTASDLSTRAGNTASDLSTRAGNTASDLSTRAGNTASNVSTRAGTAASNASSRAGNAASSLSTNGNSAGNHTGSANSVYNKGTDHTHSTSQAPTHTSLNTGSPTALSQSTQFDAETAQLLARRAHVGHEPQYEPMVFQPVETTTREKSVLVADPEFDYAGAAGVTSTQGGVNQPRSAAKSTVRGGR